MSAPILPVFSWDALKASQAELGLADHSLSGRERLALARLRRAPFAFLCAIWR